MTKGRVVEGRGPLSRERIVVKGLGDCWGGGDRRPDRRQPCLCEIKKVTASRDDKERVDFSFVIPSKAEGSAVLPLNGSTPCATPVWGQPRLLFSLESIRQERRRK